MTTISTMILGCFALLGRSCSRVVVLLRATALWIILLPIVIGYAGNLSNQAVLLANGGKFPVSINAKRQNGWADDNGYLDKVHVVMTSHTHLNALADILDYKSQGIMSVGDVLLDLSEWLFAFAPFVWGFEVTRRLLSK